MKRPKNYYFFLILVLFALLESTIWPVNLVFLLLIVWSFLRGPKEVLVNAFFAGLVSDFLTGNTLGSTSLIFLVILAAVLALRLRFFPKTIKSPWKILPFVMIAVFISSFGFSILSNWIETGKFEIFFIWQQITLEVLSSLVFFPVLEFLSLRWGEEDDFQLHLKV